MLESDMEMEEKMTDKAQAARFWLDANCEDEEAAHDFVCRLRNAMMGVNYEEGCPALDYIFEAVAQHDYKDSQDGRRAELSGRIERFKEVFDGCSDILDDLVHSLAAASASSINNRGSDAQIDFIIDELGPDQAVEDLERYAPPPLADKS